MPLGDQLRKLREARNLTQEQMGDLIGLKQPQVSAIEVGRRATTTAKLDRWIEECEAELVVRARNAVDPYADVVAAVRGLEPDELALLKRLLAAWSDLDAIDQHGLAERAESYQREVQARRAPAPPRAQAG